MEAEHYHSSGDIARILGVHPKTVSGWCAERDDIPLPDITLGPAKFKGWMDHRIPEWQRWFAKNIAEVRCMKRSSP